jgi:formiminoglutamate deiminase
MKFAFKKLLQKEGWLENVSVETDERGIITSIEADGRVEDFVSADSLAIPGFQNAHSHAFQYAMAGLAENQRGESDFWNWREAMYQLALSVNPDQIEAIARMLYAELLRKGFTNVAEFHYLHHDQAGNRYENIAETGARLVNAAKDAGINITLIPIFYQRGGFGKDPENEQRRFISKTIDEYHRLFEASETICAEQAHAGVAVGIHSLRGVETSAIKEVAESFPSDVPFHIHISEQPREVEECLEFLGKRPVEWMLDNLELSERFHLVHATHIDQDEIEGLARTQTNVVICPTTEGNLGDGIFPLREFQEAGGNWSIGTDSHVSIDPFEELRLLDYGQRLVSHRRNTFSGGADGNGGLYALRQATFAGRRAMNDFSEEFFAVGKPFNACLVSNKHPLIRTASNEHLLNTIIYSSDATMLAGTISNGIRRVGDGRHTKQESIREDFIRAVGELKTR